MENSDETILTFGEFLAGATVSDSFEQVADELAKEQNDTVLVDSDSRRDDEWGILANQVVGRESLPFVK